MAVSQPRYSKEEFARRGDEIYERDIRPYIEAGNEGKFIAIDIDTRAYEIDTDELMASDRLMARHPDAQICSCELLRGMHVALAEVSGGVRHDHRCGHSLPPGHHPSYSAWPDRPRTGDRSGNRHRVRWDTVVASC